MSKDMSNIDIIQYEGGDYAKIMDNYNLHEITAAIANRAGKAAETIEEVKREVERLENNPDVVDIVATYADLQAYDTSGLTNKDIIRVITDETQGGLSSYYRWNSPNPGWNFVGVIPGGDGIKELSSADYNYPASNPDRVALWLLDNGLYTAPAGVMVAASTTSYPWYNTSDKTILVGGSDTVKGIYTFLNGKTDVVTTQVSDGTEADEYTLFKSNQVLQTTGQSTTDTMSQKAITDAIAGGGGPAVVQTTGTSTTDVMSQNATTSMIFADPSTKQRVQIGNNSYAIGNLSMAIGYDAETGVSNNPGSIALGHGARAVNGAISIGRGTQNTVAGTVSFQDTNWGTSGYGGTGYRLLMGLYDGQSAHDAATYGQVISYSAINGAGAPTTATEGKYVGQLYYDTTDEAMYFLKTIDTTTDPVSYTWETLGGGGSVNVVQTTGTSTTDVMSQNATTSMVFADPAIKRRVQIGNNAAAQYDYDVAIGEKSMVQSIYAIAIGASDESNYNTRAAGQASVAIGTDCRAEWANAVAIGNGARATQSYAVTILGRASGESSVALKGTASAAGAVSIGAGSSATSQGEVNFGSSNTSYGYNNSNYRLLTGLYDPQSAHDAATKGYVDPSTDSSAPTTATAGRLGEIRIDTGTDTAYMCVKADTVTPEYTWKQITA